MCTKKNLKAKCWVILIFMSVVHQNLQSKARPNHLLNINLRGMELGKPAISLFGIHSSEVLFVFIHE
jgi:hypothetical protein